MNGKGARPVGRAPDFSLTSAGIALSGTAQVRIVVVVQIAIIGSISGIAIIGGIGRRDRLANDGFGDQPRIGPDLVLDFIRHINIFGEELLGVFPALADPLVAI